MNKRRHPFQKFKLDIRKIVSVCNAINQGFQTDEEIAGIVGMNSPKVSTMVEWANHLGLLVIDEGKREVSPLFIFLNGENIFQDDEFLTNEILYIELIHNHALMDLFINEIASQVINKYPSEIDKKKIESEVMHYAYNYKELQTSEKQLKTSVNLIINTLLNEEAFGSMRIMEEVNNCYMLNRYTPLLGTFLYAMSKILKNGQISVKIDELVNTPFSPGKLFLLDYEEIMKYLYRLEKKGILIVQLDGGLNQITIKADVLNQSLIEKVIELE